MKLYVAATSIACKYFDLSAPPPSQFTELYPAGSHAIANEKIILTLTNVQSFLRTTVVNTTLFLISWSFPLFKRISCYRTFSEKVKTNLFVITIILSKKFFHCYIYLWISFLQNTYRVTLSDENSETTVRNLYHVLLTFMISFKLISFVVN